MFALVHSSQEIMLVKPAPRHKNAGKKSTRAPWRTHSRLLARVNQLRPGQLAAEQSRRIHLAESAIAVAWERWRQRSKLRDRTRVEMGTTDRHGR